MSRGRPRSTPEDFWARVVIGAPDECWEWTGSRVRGYGQLRYSNLWARGTSPIRAHQVAYHLTTGVPYPMPNGCELHHVCENRGCCNPAHLEVLTPVEHGHRHNGHGCHEHGLAEWAVYNGKGKCRACDRGYKRERRADVARRQAEQMRQNWLRGTRRHGLQLQGAHEKPESAK